MITAYSADHAPPHVHVFRRGEYEIVFLLDDLVSVREIRGDARKAERLGRKRYPSARQRGTTAMAIEPRAVEAWYDREHDVISVRLDNGRLLSASRAKFQELADARPDLLQEVEILGPGSAVHFPNAGAGFTVTSLVRERYGSSRWMTRVTGRNGRKITPSKTLVPATGVSRGRRK